MGYKIYKDTNNELIHNKFGKLKYIQGGAEFENFQGDFKHVKLYKIKNRYFVRYKGKIQQVKVDFSLLGDVLSVYINKKTKCQKLSNCKQDNFSFRCLDCNKNKNFKCPECGSKTKNARIWRQNSAYNKESDNYIIACSDCFKEIQSYWAERWEEYNSSRL
jgi:hypothetical protein